MLYKLVMAGRTPGFRRGRYRSRKHGLPLHTRAPPTTFTAPASTTPTSDGYSVPPGPHTQKFVMIPNLGYHNSGPQPSFLQQASLPPSPSPGGQARSQPASAPSPTPSQPGSQDA